jgi:hypothetical protein
MLNTTRFADTILAVAYNFLSSALLITGASRPGGVEADAGFRHTQAK